MEKDIVKKLSKLAYIWLDSEQEELLRKDLEKIISWMDELNKVDTEGVEALSGVISGIISDKGTPMREDKVSGNYGRGLVMSNAPEENLGFYVIDKVIS